MNKLLLYTLAALTGYAMVSCHSSPAATAAPAVAVTVVHAQDTRDWPASFSIGRKATKKYIDSLNIDVRPDGVGLPAGSGSVAAGRAVYALQCVACHGPTGREGPQNKLVGAMGDTGKAKTIGNYWPYATTLFDYVRRAMPYHAPGSLSNDEVYAVTAFLLHANKIIDSATVMNAHSLPKVQMPARPLFVNDDRRGGPEVR